jgi:ribosomal protein S18 acetylase RimI-like enzyme
MYMATVTTSPVGKNKKTLIIASLAILGLAGGVAWWLCGPKFFAKNNIEAYQPSDIPAIKNILEEDWHWLVAEDGSFFSTDYMFEHHAATLRHADNTLSIAVYRTPEGKVAGFVTYHSVDGLQGRIQFLGVAKEYRKKGYGRELIEYAVEQLRKQGKCNVEITVRASNDPAYSLYKKLGFKESWSTPDGFIGLSKPLCV